MGDFGSRDGNCDGVDNPDDVDNTDDVDITDDVDNPDDVDKTDDVEGNVVNVEDDSLDEELVGGLCCWSNRLVRKQSQGQASKHPLPPAPARPLPNRLPKNNSRSTTSTATQQKNQASKPLPPPASRPLPTRLPKTTHKTKNTHNSIKKTRKKSKVRVRHPSSSQAPLAPAQKAAQNNIQNNTNNNIKNNSTDWQKRETQGSASQPLPQPLSITTGCPKTTAIQQHQQHHRLTPKPSQR